MRTSFFFENEQIYSLSVRKSVRMENISYIDIYTTQSESFDKHFKYTYQSLACVKRFLINCPYNYYRCQTICCRELRQREQKKIAPRKNSAHIHIFLRYTLRILCLLSQSSLQSINN